eukprot:CCRYP_003081-RD/>CCRYP_003081-RD protein AED:0.25 eAED:0.25 QI:262/1/1/1/0.5/0.2/5/1169/395
MQGVAMNQQHDAEECHLPSSASLDSFSISPDQEECCTTRNDKIFVSGRSSDVEKNTEESTGGYHHRRYAMNHFLSILRRILTTNAVSERYMLALYRRLCRCQWNTGSGHHEPLGDVDTIQTFERQHGIDEDGGVIMIKLVKLWFCSIVFILAFHEVVRKTATEIDPNYSIADFFLYDFPSVLQDLLFFFIVGRLYSHPSGVDVLYPWGVFVSLGAIYPSLIQDFQFLRHSLSMYDMMCNWPAVLFAYVAMLLILAVGLGVAHVLSHYRRGILGSRIMEVLVLFCIFFVPFITDNNFHLHHWYGMWFVGMIANSPEWWSRCLQAYCLGSYINGIAVYGRDPILGCKFAFYRSTNAECSFMDSYVSDNAGESGNHTGHYKDFVAPDWRTCDAGDLVP